MGERVGVRVWEKRLSKDWEPVLVTALKVTLGGLGQLEDENRRRLRLALARVGGVKLKDVWYGGDRDFEQVELQAQQVRDVEFGDFPEDSFLPPFWNLASV